jgi:hypothetical protein
MLGSISTLIRVKEMAKYGVIGAISGAVMGVYYGMCVHPSQEMPNAFMHHFICHNLEKWGCNPAIITHAAGPLLCGEIPSLSFCSPEKTNEIMAFGVSEVAKYRAIREAHNATVGIFFENMLQSTYRGAILGGVVGATAGFFKDINLIDAFLNITPPQKTDHDNVTDDIPENLRDSISHDLCVSPIKIKYFYEGQVYSHTYDHRALYEWWKTKKTDPLSSLDLTDPRIKGLSISVDHQKKREVEAFLARNATPTPS